MHEEFDPLESNVDNSDKLVDLLKYKKSYLMQRFVKLSYDKWRETRKRLDGTYESKWKESTDKEWNRKHGTDYVDIANTEFEDLPSNRQKERMDAASVAIDLVFDKIKDWEIRVTTEMIEEMSSVVHDNWLERREQAQDEVDSMLVQSYKNLSEEEKVKDRNHIYIAIQIIKEEIEAIKSEQK